MMTTGLAAQVGEIVDRFFDHRRAGRRVSIDQVLSDFPTPDDPSALRSSVLRQIALRARSSIDRFATDTQGEPLSLPELPGFDMIDFVGRGGMGAVYEAYQQSTGRRVAIKFLLEGAASSKAGRHRFEREVELTVRLQHPYIVSVIDSGIYRDRVYHVMEFVDGLPLDRYLHQANKVKNRQVETNRAGLDTSITQTIRLMEMICEAVDYAHHHGVLHRDLKPSNILVVEEGNATNTGKSALGYGGESSTFGAFPKIFDFGLAKFVDPELEGGLEITLSQPGQLLGTLAYMSPEQSRGRFGTMSIRSDVYSLGAIAYELITHRLPIDVHGPLAEVLERIASRDPPRPSALASGVDADLDAILLKALDKSPERRYATAGELAADFRRYLTDQPILARPARAWERVRKYVRRRRPLLALAAMTLLALTGFSVSMTVQSVRVAWERDRAFRAEMLATRTEELLRKLLTSAQPEVARGRDTTILREMLATAAKQVATEFPDRPEVRARVHGVIGEVYQSLGLFTKAEEHTRTALDMWRQLGADYEIELPRSLHRLAGLLRGQSKFAAAEPYCREALALCRKVFGERHQETLRSLDNLATVVREAGRPAEAESIERQALELRRKLLGEHPDVADSVGNLGANLVALGRYTEAEPLLHEALALRRKLQGADHPMVGVTLANLGLCQGLQNDLVSAEQSYREAIAILQVDWVRTLLGKLLLGKGDYGAAEATFRESFESMQRAGRDHDDHLANIGHNLALALCAQGRYREAEPLFVDALALFRKLFGEEHESVAVATRSLAQAKHALGSTAEAEALYEQAWSIHHRVQPSGNSESANTLAGWAGLLHDRGDVEDAEERFRQALEIHRRSTPADAAGHASVLNSLGELAAARGQFAEAQALHDEALSLQRRLLGDEHPDVAATYCHQARLLLARGQATVAEPLARDALARLGRQTTDPTLRFTAMNLLGGILASQGRYEEAKPLLIDGYAGLASQPHAAARRLNEAVRRVVDFYEASGDPDEASRWRSKGRD